MIGIGIPISHSKRPRPTVASSSILTATRTPARNESSTRDSGRANAPPVRVPCRFCDRSHRILSDQTSRPVVAPRGARVNPKLAIVDQTEQERSAPPPGARANRRSVMPRQHGGATRFPARNDRGGRIVLPGTRRHPGPSGRSTSRPADVRGQACEDDMNRRRLLCRY
jgi:hypothetical protein